MDIERSANLVEAALWFGVAVVFAWKTINSRGRLRAAFLILTVAFLIFGITRSDRIRNRRLVAAVVAAGIEGGMLSAALCTASGRTIESLAGSDSPCDRYNLEITRTGYDSGMRFQFTITRLLRSMACFAVGLGALRWMASAGSPDMQVSGVFMVWGRLAYAVALLGETRTASLGADAACTLRLRFHHLNSSVHGVSPWVSAGLLQHP